MSKLQQTLLPIKLSESKERLTSLAGLVLVEEWGRAKGIWARVEQLFGQPGSGRGYRASEYVRALVWLLHAGGRRLEDVRELAAEHEVLEQLGLRRLPSPDALGDWLRAPGTRPRGASGAAKRQRDDSWLFEIVRGRDHGGPGRDDNRGAQTSRGVDLSESEGLSTTAGLCK